MTYDARKLKYKIGYSTSVICSLTEEACSHSYVVPEISDTSKKIVRLPHYYFRQTHFLTGCIYRFI